MKSRSFATAIGLMLIWFAASMSSCGADTSPSSDSGSTSNSSTSSLESEGSREGESLDSTTTYPSKKGTSKTDSYTWRDDYLGIQLQLDTCWNRMDATRESEIKSRFLDQPNWASLFQIIAILECSDSASFIAISEYTGTNRWYADTEQQMISLGTLYLDSDTKETATKTVFRMNLEIQGFHWIQLIDEQTGIRTVQLDYFQQQNESDNWQWKSKADNLIDRIQSVDRPIE